MLVLGLLLLAAAIVAILAAVFATSGTATFLGADLGAATLFFLGVAATLAVMVGVVLTRAGTGRALRHRRESRRLRTLEDERQRAGGSATDPAAGDTTGDTTDDTTDDPTDDTAPDGSTHEPPAAD